MTHDVPQFLVSDYQFSDDDRRRLADALGPERLLIVRERAELRDALSAHPETDVLSSFFPPRDTLSLAPNLRWVALPSAGADGAFRAGLVRPEGTPIVTNASGVHAVPISEHVFSVLLLWTHHWPALLDLQRAQEWPPFDRRSELTVRELYGATLGVVGLGAIGRRVAQLGRAFGMRVVATRYSARAGDADPDVDELLPAARLHDLLRQADFVVISAPGAEQTRHLIGAEELAVMKPSAFLVNIARGSIVAEDALIAALQEGRLAGAGLDVFATEPLPSESPLWRMPNVIVSPHISGLTTAYSRRFTDILLDNLARYRAGQPLRNVVQAERGY